MAIDRERLLADCQAEMRRVVESLRERLGGDAGLAARVEGEHRRAKEAGRPSGTAGT